MNNEQILFLADVLEKTAEYIQTLEGNISELEAKINNRIDPVEKQASEVNLKLENIGLTKEQIKAMNDLPEDLIQKVASAIGEQQPWELGHGVGMKREKTDPLLEFLLS